MSAVEYRRIKVSPEHEAKMLDVLLATDQQFNAISIDEYYVTKRQCNLLTKKKIPYAKK